MIYIWYFIIDYCQDAFFASNKNVPNDVEALNGVVIQTGCS